MYVQSILDAWAPLENCVGFIDCTKVRMARPDAQNENQRTRYSSHKRFHCLIYQTRTTPDGLIFALHGGIEGIRHDLSVSRKSDFNSQLESSLNTVE